MGLFTQKFNVITITCPTATRIDFPMSTLFQVHAKLESGEGQSDMNNG